jgi:hypothetical protein
MRPSDRESNWHLALRKASMQIAFANRPLFLSATGWLTATVLASVNHPGYSLLQLPDGTINSVQPTPTFPYETRVLSYTASPQTGDGSYEQALVVGDKLVYQPAPGQIAVIPFVTVG